MGSVRKGLSDKKQGGLPSLEVAKPYRVPGASSKKNEIDEIFGRKKRSHVTQNQEIPAEDDGMESRTSSLKKKKVKKTAPSVAEDGKVTAGKQSKGDGKGRKSSSSSAAEPGLSKRRKKTADGLTVYGG